MMLKIGFSDGGEFCQRLIMNLVSRECECVIDNVKPDVLVYSLYGTAHYGYACKKILVIAENSYPDFNECDYAVSPHDMTFGPRHLRVPFFAFNKEYQLLLNNDKRAVADVVNRKFCCAVISNNICADPKRAEFLMRLDERCRIDSVGSAFNNTGRTLPPRPPVAENLDGLYTNDAKVKFMSEYKFSLALENSSVAGYCTEKITDSFVANTIPIYWGDPLVSAEFNSRSFVNVLEYGSYDRAIDRILSINENDDLYRSMLAETNVINRQYHQQLKDFILAAINGPVFEHRYGNICLQNLKRK